ncbi:MAG: hypothetical protein JRH18_13285 [Deltaproteobacteria bacterium]|nr:hypothetical protein [Deltaproteobacteria bacterium]MBW2152629.1 hypothetical protein [Deltaproteobacteria bacterium]
MLNTIFSALFNSRIKAPGTSIFDPMDQFDENASGRWQIIRSMNAAFLIRLAGPKHKAFKAAGRLLERACHTQSLKETAQFYLEGIENTTCEIERVIRKDKDFKDAFMALYHFTADDKKEKSLEQTSEKLWAVFFPEAVGLRNNYKRGIDELRKKRTVEILSLKTDPISDPARQLLFISNVLLTLPDGEKRLEALHLSEDLKRSLAPVLKEPQQYWFDHPIQIGVAPESNEFLYGLRALEKALAFERVRGNATQKSRITCILSVSVTHRGLRLIAKRYLKEEIQRNGDFKGLDIYMFSESQTDSIIKDILAPAARYYLGVNNAEALLSVFGVDGEYGRHYSFLKAVSALWQVLVSPEIKATFKIDLDQIFPQKELVEQTGASAFEHFKTPLWGAKGVDTEGFPVDLGMIAGALVNEKDIGRCLFTPDVPFPDRSPVFEEYIFFNQLPQAISTRAEMMTRYDTEALDGRRRCIQRIHITGGTNGILTESLFKHRPFTPSFIGRAEDQAYILSVICRQGERLAYVHKDGLIMRHDKEAFAQQAIESARIGTLIGDYVRILYFSAYARVLAEDITTIKKILDPFTGCFISKIPTAVVMLRFALKAASFFTAGKNKEGGDFVTNGAFRIKNALDFIRNGGLKQHYEREQRGWNLYYDTLEALREALKREDEFAVRLKQKTRAILDQCLLSG